MKRLGWPTSYFSAHVQRVCWVLNDDYDLDGHGVAPGLALATKTGIGVAFASSVLKAQHVVSALKVGKFMGLVVLVSCILVLVIVVEAASLLVLSMSFMISNFVTRLHNGGLDP